MSSWFTAAQLSFALFVAGVIAERVRALYFRDATSEEGLRWILRALEQGDRVGPRAWARARPRAHCGRVLACALEGEAASASALHDEHVTSVARSSERALTAEGADLPGALANADVLATGAVLMRVGEQDLRELLADLREEAIARLRFLRVAATLASTTGLLGGILRLARGPSIITGLAALKAGEPERLMVMEAIATMAIGVALSALCFQALALLRPAAQQLISQTLRVARAVSLREDAWLLG